MRDKPIEIKHPAPFPRRLLLEIDKLLHKYGDPKLAEGRLLDPFAGIGRIATLGGYWNFHGCELEPEWAKQAEALGMKVHVGDASNMPWPDEQFAALVTSPAYGNRLADSYAPDMSDPKNKNRRSYRIYLGRELSPGSGASEKWGDEYRRIHRAVWEECHRVLAPGGVFVLNCKDHFRDGKEHRVTEWHVHTLLGLGFMPVEARPVALRGDQNTNTMRSRGVRVVDVEWLVVLRKEETAVRGMTSDEIDTWVSENLVESVEEDDEPEVTLLDMFPGS